MIWGKNVLHVAHLAPPRAFHVGHGDGVDFVLPAELAPFARAAIVQVKDGGAYAPPFPLRSCLRRGWVRRRLPVAWKMALASAGPTGPTGGSPISL